MKITVVGLGKIGLPLAVQFTARGYHVVDLRKSGLAGGLAFEES